MKARKKSKIGIVGKGSMSAMFYEYLVKNLPGATFVDAADSVDSIKAIEVNGPGGMYAEIGRVYFLGKVPPELSDAYELCKETQKVTLKLLKPGADPAQIWRANNEFLVKKGELPKTRLYAHGQGYDLVERPAIRDDEPMKLRARMNITVHPTIGSERIWVWVCDNYLITESGIEPLHKAPQEIFSI